MMWIAGWLWRECKGNWPHLNLILRTQSNFAFLGWHQCSSRLVTVLWGLSGVQSSKSNLLTCLIGKTQLLWTQCRGIGPHLIERGKSHGFLELRQEPGVYSRVTEGMSIRNWSLFSEVRTPVSVWGTHQECKLGVAAQYGRFWKLSESSGLFFYLTQWYWDS